MSFYKDLDPTEKRNFKENALSLIMHEDKLFTSRVNLLLVAESLLFFSFVTAITNEKAMVANIHIVIGVFGFLITFLIGSINIRTYLNLRKLKDAINDAQNLLQISYFEHKDIAVS